MVNQETDPAPSNASWLDADTHRRARHVVAGHSENAEECSYFLALLGIDALPADGDDPEGHISST